MWVILAVLIIFASFVFYILLQRKFTFFNILLKTTGSLLEKSLGYKMQTASLKLFTLMWIISVLIITNSYKALLLSLFSHPKFSGIRNIADLSKASLKNTVTCFTFKGEAHSQIFSLSDLASWKPIGDCLRRNEFASGDPKSYFLGAPRKKVFIAGKIYLIPYLKNYFISKDYFYPVMYAFPVSERFRCLKQLNSVIHRLTAAGIFEKYMRDETFLLRLKMKTPQISHTDTARKLNLSNMKEAFYLLISGYILATFAFFAEIIYDYTKKIRTKNKK